MNLFSPSLLIRPLPVFFFLSIFYFSPETENNRSAEPPRCPALSICGSTGVGTATDVRQCPRMLTLPPGDRWEICQRWLLHHTWFQPVFCQCGACVMEDRASEINDPDIYVESSERRSDISSGIVFILFSLLLLLLISNVRLQLTGTTHACVCVCVTVLH